MLQSSSEIWIAKKDKCRLFFLAWIVRTKIKCLLKFLLLCFYGVVGSLEFLNLESIGTSFSVILQFRSKIATSDPLHSRLVVGCFGILDLE